jgi:phage shock protein A
MFGASLVYAIGGILDQLIDDAEKQLVKSRECIVWYREEAKEYEQKLNNLRQNVASRVVVTIQYRTAAANMGSG